LLVKDKNESGQVAGMLYFVSTLGSAIGTIVTSFYLVLFFDINAIIISFSLILLVLGLSAIFLNRFFVSTINSVKASTKLSPNPQAH